MRTPTTFSMFRSAHSAALAWEILTASTPQTVTELAAKVGVDRTTASRACDELEADGLVSSTRLGRARLVRGRLDTSAARPLRELLEATMEVPAIISSAFADVRGVTELRVFGSWAARVSGIPGPPPHDIDLLVRVANAAPREIDAAVRTATQRLGTPVSPTLVDAHEPSEGGRALLRALSSKPSVRVVHAPQNALDGAPADLSGLDDFIARIPPPKD